MWVNLFAKNRVAKNGMALTYIPPPIVNGQMIVNLDKDQVDRENEKWKGALTAYVIGDMPVYNAMKRYIELNWNAISEPYLYMQEGGYYIIKFKTRDDMQEILYSGPYTISNRHIILKQWTTYFDFEKEFTIEIPLWIKLPKLPLNCWGNNSLSRIASSIRTPMYADECTAKQIRVSYARMLIEVDVTKPRLDEINVEDPNGRVFRQPIIYDWKPIFCEKCQVIGHKYQQEGRRQEHQHKDQVKDKKGPKK
ncbi:uncharacterized protein LOC142178405 [Nicotiana tabacum]|uniref:Uncharacterized protein LOC142178405 n=1 Tax=Nicotiana tabacum TaxID=4097 RepID=A0AC58U2Z0_TOBAC